LVLVIIQNKIRMVYPVSCTAACSYVKSWGGPSKFWGVRTPPTPPVVAPLSISTISHAACLHNPLPVPASESLCAGITRPASMPLLTGVRWRMNEGSGQREIFPRWGQCSVSPSVIRYWAGRRKDIRHVKNLRHSSEKVPFRNKCRNESNGIRLTLVHPGNGHRYSSSGVCVTARSVVSDGATGVRDDSSGRRSHHSR